MRSRQVGFVIVGLIAIGIIGLIFRVISTGDDEVVLTGLLPIHEGQVDAVIISDNENTVVLEKTGNFWTANKNNAFGPKLNQFWRAVDDIDGALLIAQNPANHERMGVTPEQATRVEFKQGSAEGFTTEAFYVHISSADVRTCYIRPTDSDDVYGIPCERPDIFDTDPDGWRDPVILAIPRNAVESITFDYPDEQFSLNVFDGNWVVTSGNDVFPANLAQVDVILTAIELMIADGFATDEERRGLNMDVPDSSVRIVTNGESGIPTTRLRLVKRDDLSYYANTPAQTNVFILDSDFVDFILSSSADFLSGG